MKLKSLMIMLLCMVFTLVVTACNDHQHDFATYTLTTNPTMDAAGSASSTCSCGESETIEVPALSDTSVWTVKSTTDSTCTVAGNKVYESVYGEVTVALELLAHDYVTYTITTEPTLTTVGSATHACACGATTTVEVAALSDTSVWTVKSTTPSTCTVAGNKVYESVYGEVTVALELLAHDYVTYTITTEPTLSAVGSATHACACGATTTVEVAALSDTSVWTVKSTTPSTCTVAGNTVYESVYGEVTVALELLVHEYTTYTLAVNPTLSAVGSATTACACGATTTVEVAALSDTSVWAVKSTTPSTCTVAGNKVYESVYGEVTVALDLLAHEYTTYTLAVNPTLSAVGSATVACACGATTTVEVATLSDTSVWAVKSTTPSTCTVAGNTVYESVYGEVTVALDLLAHEYTIHTLAVEPTIDTVGSATAACACGAATTVEVAVLSDTSVWNVTTVDADYNNAGSSTYTSVYGEVVVAISKLVAPYDGKTYVSLQVEAMNEGEYKNGVLTPASTWNEHKITFDANGCGLGTAYPFRKYIEITMVDSATGKILVTQYDIMDSGEDDADGNNIYVKNPDESLVRQFTAYVDFETGIIVCSTEHEGKYNFWVPFESIVREDLTVSVWYESIAMTYTTPNGDVINVFNYKNVTYFNVSYVNASGETLTGDACYNSSLLAVKDANNNDIVVFAHNGEKLVVADGLQGTYTNGTDTILVSGAGIATLNGAAATYVINDSNAIGVYTADAYYDVTLDKANSTCIVVKPMVTVTFNTFDKVALEAVTVNKNVAYVLPTISCETFAFKGWYYDSNCTMAVEANFVPTKDVVLYASWKEKVVITLVGVLDGDTTTLYLGEGDIIGEALPVYGVEYAAGKKFIGWFLDETFEISLPEEAEVTAEDTGIVIYACWEEIPVYYGTYYGANTYGDGGTRTTSTALSIDENGNITGKWTGTVDSYDPTTGIITWHKSNEDTVCYLWFDETSGVLVTGYKNQYSILGDFFTFSRNCEKGSKNMVDRRLASSVETRLISVPTEDNSFTLVLVYNENLYGNITIEGTNGVLTTIDQVKADKQVVIKDKNGNTIVGVVATGANFSSSTANTVLDKYFGTYTNGDETITLDGKGNVVYGELTGTYTAATEGASYTLDVYLNNNSVYYELTLSGSSFEMVKPMVTVTFVTGEGHGEVAAQQFNKNVVASLPNVEEVGYVFNGWFTDADLTNPVTEFTPVEDTTLYAKFSAPVTLTINYCDDVTEPVVITYSFGDVVTLDTPVRTGYVFKGWYTTATYDEESVWESGSVIETAIIIYAKWEGAPDYVGSYYGAEVYGDKTGSVSTGKYLTIDASFNMTSSRATGTILPETYDAETGYIKYLYNGTEYVLLFTQYNGLDIIIMNWTASTTDPVSNDIFVFVKGTTSCTYDKTPDENGHANHAVWNSKNERAVTLTFDTGDITFYINSNENKVYGNVVVKDGLGNTIKPGAILDANLSVFALYGENGTKICEYGKDDSGNIVGLDGLQGTYTNANDTLVVDGVKNVVLNGVAGTYFAVSDASYTLDVYAGGCYYEVTLDQTTMACTVVKPMVTLTFDLAGGAFDVEPATSYNKNIEITLLTPVKEGFVFKGWSIDGTVVSSNYVPTADATLTATWSGSVNVTFVMNNGDADVVVAVESGTVATIENPVKEDHTFVGWYKDADLTIPYENEAVTETMTLYAKWMTTPKFVDTYKGVEVWGSSKTGSASGNKSASINESFYMSAGKSGQIDVNSYNPVTGVFKYTSSNKNYLALFMTYANYKFLLVNYSASEDDAIKGTDYYFYVNSTDVTYVTQYIWNSGNERIVEMTVDGSTMLFYINSNENLFIPCVTITTLSGDAIAVSELGDALSLVITLDTTVVKEYAKDGSSFVALDGYQGTYTGDLGTVVLDGAGTVTVDGVLGTYKVEDTVVELTYNSVTKAVALSGSTYTCVTDATMGTYTLGDNVFVSNGDGTCTLNGVSGTYTKDGMNVTYTVGDVSTTILLNSDGTYAEKSIFAGLTFKGTYFSDWDGYNLEFRVVFDDATTISGTMYSGSGTSYYFNFTGELVGNTLTLTITTAVDRGQVGKTVVFEISGSTMTVVDSTMTSNVYTFDENGSVSCNGFSL